MSSPTPTLSPTASNDDDNDEDGPRFGGTPLIVGGVVSLYISVQLFSFES